MLRPVALQYLEQVVAFAFADDLIEQHEVDEFDDAVARIGIVDTAIADMRRRMKEAWGLDIPLFTHRKIDGPF